MRTSFILASDSYEKFNVMLNVCIKILNSKQGEPIKEGNTKEHQAFILLKKIILHLLSIEKLCKRLDVQFHDKRILSINNGPIDHSSICVLLRSAYETYLAIDHIFIKPSNELAWKIWKLESLLTRQKIQPTNTDDKQKQLEERIEAENIMELIRKTEVYNALSQKQKQRISRGDWRIGQSWKDLAKSANFHQHWFSLLYDYLCSYSHPGFTSYMQIKDADNPQQQKILTEKIITSALPLMSKIITNSRKIIEKSDLIANANPIAKKLAKFNDITEHTYEENSLTPKQSNKP